MGDKRPRLSSVPSNEAQLYNLSSYPPKKRFRSMLDDITNAPPPPCLLPAKKRVYAPWAEETRLLQRAQEEAEVPLKAPPPAARPPAACSLCQSSSDSEWTGTLARYDAVSGSLVELSPTTTAEAEEQVYVHWGCAEWAPNVYFSGDRVNNLESEIKRAQALSCAACGVKGAALGCFSQRCRRSYHYGCARRTADCAWDCANFLLLCPQHAPTCSRYRSRNVFLSEPGE